MSIRIVGFRDGRRIVIDEGPSHAAPLPGWHPGGQAVVVPSEAARHRRDVREHKRKVREAGQ